MKKRRKPKKRKSIDLTKPMLWIALTVAMVAIVIMDVNSVDLNKQLNNALFALNQTKVDEQMLADDNKRLNDELQPYLSQKAKKRIDDQHKLELHEYNNQQIRCLAVNMYEEGAREPVDGLVAIGTVVMNRAKTHGYPKTPCGVVYQHIVKHSHIECAFSWVCKHTSRIVPSVYSNIYKLAQQIYLKHVRSALAPDALFYYADYINPPRWAADNQMITQIGTHIFLKPISSQE
jgi:spore germination cell wall hydrolase CwlJ-like protein